jgi:hypothetical protein
MVARSRKGRKGKGRKVKPRRTYRMRGGGGENPEEAKAARAAVNLAGNSDAQTAAYRAWRMKYPEAYAAELAQRAAAYQAMIEEDKRRTAARKKPLDDDSDDDEEKTTYGSTYGAAIPSTGVGY